MPNGRTSKRSTIEPNINHTTNHISNWTPAQPQLSAGAQKRQAFKDRQFEEGVGSYFHKNASYCIQHSEGDKGTGKLHFKPREEAKTEARLAERKIKRGLDIDVKVSAKKRRPKLGCEDWDGAETCGGGETNENIPENGRIRADVDIRDLIRPGRRSKGELDDDAVYYHHRVDVGGILQGFDPVRRPETIPEMFMPHTTLVDFSASFGVPATPNLRPVVVDDDDAEWEEAGHSEFSFDLFSEHSGELSADEDEDEVDDHWYHYTLESV